MPVVLCCCLRQAKLQELQQQLEEKSQQLATQAAELAKQAAELADLRAAQAVQAAATGKLRYKLLDLEARLRVSRPGAPGVGCICTASAAVCGVSCGATLQLLRGHHQAWVSKAGQGSRLNGERRRLIGMEALRGCVA